MRVRLLLTTTNLEHWSCSLGREANTIVELNGNGDEDCVQVQVPEMGIGKDKASVGRNRGWRSASKHNWHFEALDVEFDQHLQVRLGFKPSRTPLSNSGAYLLIVLGVCG